MPGHGLMDPRAAKDVYRANEGTQGSKPRRLYMGKKDFIVKGPGKECIEILPACANLGALPLIGCTDWLISARVLPAFPASDDLVDSVVRWSAAFQARANHDTTS